MRKIFTLSALAVLTALSASAALPKAMLENAKATMVRSEVHNQVNRQKVEMTKDVREAARKHRAPVRRQEIPAPSDADKIIETPPTGTTTTMTKTGMGMAYSWFGLVVEPLNGSLVDVVRCDNNEVYINNPFSLSLMPGWLKGTVDGNKISIKLPQLVNVDEWDYGDGDVEVYRDYCVVMEYGEDEEGWYYFPADNQTYTMTIQADGTITADDPELMLGMCDYFDPEEVGEENGGWAWQILGDILESYVPFDAKALEVPSDVTFEEWYLCDDYLARPVSVGISGDKIYIKGLCDLAPELGDAAVVGTITDGKATFANGQYLGVFEDYLNTIYFMTGDLEEVYDEEYDETYESLVKSDELVFAYDAEKKSLRAVNAGFCMSVDPELMYYFTVTNNPYIHVQDPNATIVAPKSPFDVYYYEAYPEWDEPAEIDFSLPNIDVDGNVLDLSNIYYNILIDGEPMTFYPDEYEGLDDEITDVPYGYYCDGGIFGYPEDGYNIVYIYSEGYDTIGVRTVYKDGDTVLYSEPVILVINESKVNGVELGESVSAEYYDLQGRRVSPAAKGLLIKKEIKADGSFKATKVMKK